MSESQIDRTRFEYKEVQISSAGFIDELNQHGADGWALALYSPPQSGFQYGRVVLIRRVIEESDRYNTDKPATKSPLEHPIQEIGWSARTRRFLREMDIKFLEELINRTERQLLRHPGLGRASLNEIKAILDGLGLSLRKDGDK